LVLTHAPPPVVALVATSLKPAGQRHWPLLTLPPSQTMLSTLVVGAGLAAGGRGGGIGAASATQCPLVSRWVLTGHVHWPERLRVPPSQGPIAAGAGDGSGIGGGACDGLATQRPFLYSCQGKHWESWSDCAARGSALKNARPIKIAAVAEMRAMLEPRRHRQKQAAN
jgi:hypothetical protein